MKTTALRIFKDRCDNFIRRLEVKFRYRPWRDLLLLTKLATANLFRNYYGGKEKLKPKKVVFKKLFLRWNLNRSLSLEVGRDKKPFSRIGLNSSERTLFADKAKLFLDLKKVIGDYYSEQVGAVFKPSPEWKLFLATSYGWSLKDKNLLPKGARLSEKSYWLNNLWGRFEFSPPGWGERKKNNTTFGGKTLSVGLSIGGFWNLEEKTAGGNRDLKVLLREADIFFRSPKWSLGRLTLLGEYDKADYLLKGVPNRSLEGFDFQFGFRPMDEKLFELGLDFEDIQKHPGGVEEKIYRGGFNLYPLNRLKVSYTYTYTDWNGKFSDKPQRVHTIQLQITF